MIETNVKQLLSELADGNNLGESVTLVAATKTQSVEAINRAIAAGVSVIGENREQEFTQKYDGLPPCQKHFIGHLQTNKVKYLIGKVDLYHSLDRDELAEELNRRSKANNITSNVLIQINIGSELSKSGYELSEGYVAFKRLENYKNLKIEGLMAMLPLSNDEKLLKKLCLQMRELYDKIRSENTSVKYLSMGMSGDYRLCLENGSNMVRVGTGIFGARNYNA